MLGFRTPIECHIRDKLAEAEGGRTEVAAGHGYADVVTDKHRINSFSFQDNHNNNYLSLLKNLFSKT